MRNAYDPLIYAYMRSFGMPSTYYHTYLTELTLPARKHRRKPAQPSPTLNHPTQLDWVTPNIVTIAPTYLKDDNTVPTCQKNVEIARQRLLDAATPLKQAGARRTLIHQQAKLLASLMRAWQDAEVGLITADNYQNVIARAVPVELSDAQDSKLRAQQKIYADRQAQKYAARKHAILMVEWTELKDRYAATRRVYIVARARWRLAQVKLDKARAARRMDTGDDEAHAPIPAVQEWKHARELYRTALQDRDRVRREWKACKVKLYRLSRVATS